MTNKPLDIVRVAETVCVAAVVFRIWGPWANRLLSTHWSAPGVRIGLVVADVAVACALYVLVWLVTGRRRPQIGGLRAALAVLISVFAVPDAAAVLGHQVPAVGMDPLGWLGGAALIAALSTLCRGDR